MDTDATTNVQRWTSPPFLDEVTAWVATAARGHGVRLTGEREQPRARPWSTVVRFASTAGDLWFKVNAAGTAHEGRLVGVPAHTAGTLPQDVRGLVAELVTVPVEAGGLGEEDQDRLAELLPAYDGWCRELAGSGLPDTIQHDDLHSGNICWPGPAAATARLIDWGDASVGVPLGTSP